MSKKLILEPVIDLITKIFGKNALSKTIGTRTNVITLPDADVKRIIKNELDIAKASDEQLEVFRKRAEQLIPDIPKMNDQELLTFKGNLQRYYNKMYPPSAQVFDFETKRKFSPKGIEQLETEVGLPPDVDVKSPLGRMLQESKFNLKDVGKIFDDILGGPKKTTEELYEQTRKSIEEPTEAEKTFRAQEKTRIGQVFDETAQAQSSYIKMQNEGLVRATAREIMERDIKSGKLKIPKEEMQVITEYSSVNDPIDIWRKYYGEDALEQLDSMVPDFYQMTSSREAADAATKKFTFEPKLDRLPGSYDPDKPPEFADGGRVHAAGGLMKGMIDWLVKNRNFAKELLDRVSKQKNGEKLIKELYEAETKKSGTAPMTMGEAPKTDLKKVTDKVETDKRITGELAKDKQIPVKDQTEQKTKTIKKILTEDDLRALGKKEGIPDQDVEKFLSGELGLLRRDQARGVIQRDKEGNIVIKDKYSKKYDPLRENPVFKDETIIPQDVITVPEPFKGKYQQEFLAHDQIFGKRSGDNKIDAELIAEQVAEMKGLDYDDMGYTEKMDLYDKAYNYLSLLDRTTGAMKEAKGRTLQANGGVAYLMGL